MNRPYAEILNPVGAKETRQRGDAAASGKARGTPVIGLLNDSKPNVAFFLQAVEEAILSEGKGYQIFNSTKPKSAGPSPDIDLLAERCDFVINAVSD